MDSIYNAHGGLQVHTSPACRASNALQTVDESAARLFACVNELLPIGSDMLEWSSVVTLAELCGGGPTAAAQLRSRVREMEQPGSRFGHLAETDIISSAAFVRFVAGTLRTPRAEVWEALQIVCGVTHLYRMAVDGSNESVTWQQLQKVFARLGATATQDTKAAAKVWRAMSPRGDAASLPQMLRGVLAARLASPSQSLEKELAAAYVSFRGSHLRSAAAALTMQANEDADEATYVLNAGFAFQLLEVLYAYTGQPWLVLCEFPEMDHRHSGYLLKSVNGRAVGGESPEAIAALMEARPSVSKNDDFCIKNEKLCI